MGTATDFLYGAALLSLLTALLTPALKWAAMDPLSIEEGPSWLGAGLSSIWAMMFVMLAIIFHADGRPEVAAVLGSYGYGAGIGACFLVSYKPLRKEEPNLFLRWWRGKLNSLGDSAFKSVLIWPLAALASWLIGIDGGFWVTAIVGLVLMVAKTGVALGALHSEDGQFLYASRQRMLIHGSLFMTSVVGTACMASWMVLIRLLMAEWEPLTFLDYQTAFAFFLGLWFRPN